MIKNGMFFTFNIQGLEPDFLRVVDFTFDEAISELFDLQIQLVSFDHDIELNAQLLKSATLTIWNSGVLQRKITGIVIHFERGQTGVRRTYWRARIKPEAWVLTLTQDSRIFHQLSFVQILAILLKQDNIRSQLQFFTSHSTHEYVTQKRETNWEFFNRLSSQEGIIYWFDESESSGTSIVCSDSYQACQLGPDLVYNPEPIFPYKESVISDISIRAVSTSSKVIQKDRNWLNPEYRLRHEDSQSGAGKRSGFNVFESYGRFQYDASGLGNTRYRMQAIQSNSLLGQAVSNCINVMPGKIFTVNSHPIESMNTGWQVVSVRHRGCMPQSAEEESDGGANTLSNEINFVEQDCEWKKEFFYKPLSDGPEVATVVGPKGEEIYTNEYGCVKVAFHWNRYDPADDRASCWIRVAQGWNGGGFGFIAIPRIGHEVIVTYLDGDIDRPLITGCVYNPQSRPPLNLPADKTRTTFKTKTHKGDGFNELRFDDNLGKEEVYIHAQYDMNSEVMNRDTLWVGKDKVSHVLGQHHLRVEDEKRDLIKKDYSLNVEQTMHLKTGENLLIVNANEFHLKTGNKVVLDAGVEITLKAGGNFICLDPSGIRTSEIVFMGEGSPGKGTDWDGKLPEDLQPGKNKAEFQPPMVEARPELENSLCIECLLNAIKSDASVVQGDSV